ncbi:RNA polymerase sigma factor [Roseiarcaceae bacterium H3SJ34-1]|uniref:RNA polymerase sigma factor n=1 Tax=Terripilifer ovatus TaxID=3032367 RepID=UPI003AB9A0C9|nr:RNA polymerase sigma factor [Roseiarcaceae bacterium H3SJ34-1]
MSDTDTHRAILAIWRIEQARLIAVLARMMRDVGLAEDLAQETLVTALERWPAAGVPENPGAWLMMTAKNRAIDHLRRDKMRGRKHAEIVQELEAEQFTVPDFDAAMDDDIGDDLLRLIFTACHPILSREARAALTLRMIGGLTTEEIARAFLSTETTVGQRIVRAKRTLSESGLAYETPRGEALAQRLASVLEVIYLIFNEGYAATAGEDWMRPQLCEEALRLGRILSTLAPLEPEVHGLVGLMELHASRAAARTNATGEPVLLLEQNRTRWDRLLIQRGLAALERAEALDPKRGVYTLQAAMVACHARAPTAAVTDWTRIAALYAELALLMPSPVVELNRAVAVAMAEGPQAGLDIVDRLTGEPALKRYHLLPSVRGDFLVKLGRHEEARAEFERAAALATNQRERDLMLKRSREATGL